MANNRRRAAAAGGGAVVTAAMVAAIAAYTAPKTAPFEGFVACAYVDRIGRGHPLTIGYGHTGPDVYRIGHLTQQQGLQLLRKDLARYEAPVNALGIRFNQHQYDALVSFTYNLGPLYLARGHTLGDALHRKDWNGVANAFLLYDRAGGQRLPGLTRRRRAERALFLKPVKKLSKVQKWRNRLAGIRLKAHEHGWTKQLMAEARRLKAAIARSKA